MGRTTREQARTKSARPRANAQNQYYLCQRGNRVSRWYPPFDPAGLPADCRFMGRVLDEFERSLPQMGFTVYVTWNPHWVPSTGPHVVVICLGDEWSMWPRYASQVAAVFKTMGTSPSPRGLWSSDPRFLLSNLASYVRVHVLGLPTRPAHVRWLITSPARRSIVEVIPLGTCNVDFDHRPSPAEPRPLDLMFQGSIVHGPKHLHGVRRYLPSPKTWSRRRLETEVQAMALRYPSLRIHFGSVGSFAESISADRRQYTDLLASARICLAPRGTNIETYRAFEGFAMGCVVVADRLPRRWYYEDCGIVEINDWRRLPHVVEWLLLSPGAEARLSAHAALSRQAWLARCSPAAVADRVVRALTQSRGRTE